MVLSTIAILKLIHIYVKLLDINDPPLIDSYLSLRRYLIAKLFDTLRDRQGLTTR